MTGLLVTYLVKNAKSAEAATPNIVATDGQEGGMNIVDKPMVTLACIAVIAIMLNLMCHLMNIERKIQSGSGIMVTNAVISGRDEGAFQA